MHKIIELHLIHFLVKMRKGQANFFLSSNAANKHELNIKGKNPLLFRMATSARNAHFQK